MRLIGTIETQLDALKFSAFLTAEEIAHRCEPTLSNSEQMDIWIVDEDDLEKATHWLAEFQAHPSDPRFETSSHPLDTQGVAAAVNQSETPTRTTHTQTRKRYLITRLIIALCSVLFVCNAYQMKEESVASLTPLSMQLSYDTPRLFTQLQEMIQQGVPLSQERLDHLERAPMWRGLYDVLLHWPQSKTDLQAPLFIQLRQGEAWRLFTPCLMHGNFLHILFNMMWFWTLGSQVEARLKRWQYLVLTVVIGIISNTVQYLMSGPFFLGYSGVICGLAAFIWMRQRCAPWEGYPFPRSSAALLGSFVLVMAGIQVISFIALRFHLAEMPMMTSIANSAHISGAITGLILGALPIFSKDFQ